MIEFKDNNVVLELMSGSDTKIVSNNRCWIFIHKYFLKSNDELEIEEVESICKVYLFDLG